MDFGPGLKVGGFEKATVLVGDDKFITFDDDSGMLGQTEIYGSESDRFGGGEAGVVGNGEAELVLA